VFLKAIDGTTPHFRSEGDVFRDTVRLQGPCPPPAPMMSLNGVYRNAAPASLARWLSRDPYE
jgi:hypothetical protein